MSPSESVPVASNAARVHGADTYTPVWSGQETGSECGGSTGHPGETGARGIHQTCWEVKKVGYVGEGGEGED